MRFPIPDEIYRAFDMERPEEDGRGDGRESQKASPYGDNGDFLSAGTKEAPVFLCMTETPSEYRENIIDEVTLVACTGVKPVNFEENRYRTYTEDCASLRIMEGKYKGEGRTVPIRGLRIERTVRDREETEELLKSYRDIMDKVNYPPPKGGGLPSNSSPD